MNPIIPLITAAIGLVTKSPEGQKRRNLKIAKKTLKQLTKSCRKDDGVIDEEEQAMLDKLEKAIIQKAIDL